MQGLLAFFSLLGGLSKFFTDWWQRRRIRKDSENENLAQGFRRVLQLLRESDEARNARARLDADAAGLHNDDGYKRK